MNWDDATILEKIIGTVYVFLVTIIFLALIIGFCLAIDYISIRFYGWACKPIIIDILREAKGLKS